MDGIEIVERIKLIPGAFVDCSFRQGRELVLKQLTRRSGKNEEGFVDVFINNARNAIEVMSQSVKPNTLPRDYLLFLEYYGGLSIDHEHYYFSTFGIGVMVEDDYPSVDSDMAFPGFGGKYGFQPLGALNFRHKKYKYQEVSFFLDVADRVQQYCVISIGPWGERTVDPTDIIENLQDYPDQWQRIAGSFTEWLELVAKTEGVFGYL